MKKRLPVRAAAMALALTLGLSTAAGAITVDEARDLLRKYYIDEISEEILSLPTVDEITDALGDPYTYYMTAEEYAAFQSELNGVNVVGIGVMVENTADGLLVIGVAPDSPGDEAGLHMGDLIVAADGVTVNNLVPGVILTDRNEKILSDEAFRETVRSSVPLGRFGSVADMAGAALLLCSEAGAYITGIELPVTGGMHL